MRYPPFRPALVLYSTGGCHLCERAEALIRWRVGANLDLVEIADDPELLERYGVRIPVLRRLDTEQELNWPFDEQAVQSLLMVQNPPA